MGKTFCFLIPLIETLEYSNNISVCIISPTRELCDQIKAEALKLKSNLRIATIYGGTSYYGSYKDANVIVAAPGRLLDLLRSGQIDLSHLNSFVLDEADKLLDMGFERDIRAIKDFISKSAKCYMFSATYSKNLTSIINDFLPKDRIKIEIENETIESIKQDFIETTDKPSKLREILESLNLEPKWIKDAVFDRVLIFVERKAVVGDLEKLISSWGILVVSLHGDKEQSLRSSILYRFKTHKVNVLVATSVAARGIDVQGINYVINYDFPRDIKEYIHRIGRTGRQGQKGEAISFLSPNELSSELKHSLIKVLKESKNTVPTFLTKESTLRDSKKQHFSKSKDVNPVIKGMKKMNISESESKYSKEKEDSMEDEPGVW